MEILAFKKLIYSLSSQDILFSQEYLISDSKFISLRWLSFHSISSTVVLYFSKGRQSQTLPRRMCILLLYIPYIRFTWRDFIVLPGSTNRKADSLMIPDMNIYYPSKWFYYAAYLRTNSLECSHKVVRHFRTVLKIHPKWYYRRPQPLPLNKDEQLDSYP